MGSPELLENLSVKGFLSLLYYSRNHTRYIRAGVSGSIHFFDVVVSYGPTGKVSDLQRKELLQVALPSSLSLSLSLSLHSFENCDLKYFLFRSIQQKDEH